MSATMLPRYGWAAPRRPTAAIYRRRRLAALALIGALALAGVFAVRALGVAPLSVTGRHAPVPASSPETVSLRIQPVAETSYVVQPGDTLWSIARHLHPDGDVRPVVDELVTQLHGHPLDAGQRLVLPSVPLGGR